MKSPLKRLISGLVIVLTVLVTSLVAASPAQAERWNCPINNFCLWMHANFLGDWFTPSGAGTEFPNFKSKGFNDITSSLWNNSSHTWCLYEHANYSGRSIRLGPQFEISNMRNSGFNDIASSARIC